ncbi:MAG: hypothetical protein QOC94_979 [Actinoplanes sp.]|jgi:hypothetical protein|nr:hypothetical protein [Actinoplanes sp.]
MAEADCAATTYAVDRGTWSNLPLEFAEMVAPPITVSRLPADRPGDVDAHRLTQQARSRANMPVERRHRPTR